VTILQAWDLETWGLILGNGRVLSLVHCVQSASGGDWTSYPMHSGGYLSRGKASWAWIWPHTSVWSHGWECTEVYFL